MVLVSDILLCSIFFFSWMISSGEIIDMVVVKKNRCLKVFLFVCCRVLVLVLLLVSVVWNRFISILLLVVICVLGVV